MIEKEDAAEGQRIASTGDRWAANLEKRVDVFSRRIIAEERAGPAMKTREVNGLGFDFKKEEGLDLSWELSRRLLGTANASYSADIARKF